MHLPLNPNNLICVYALTSDQNGPTETLYVGCCRLTEIIALPDAHQNRMFREIKSHLSYVTISTLQFFTTDGPAQEHRAAKAIELKAICNTVPNDPSGSERGIICNETNETFKNASAACRAFGIHASAMTRHLHGEVGYKSLKGYTFRRANDTSAI